MADGSEGGLAARVTYAPAAASPGGRAVIRAIETATGRLALLARTRGVAGDLAAGRSLWDAVPDRCGLSLQVLSGDLGAIPRTGPVIVVANHPFGILDGLMLGRILAEARGDHGFRILANVVFARAPDLAPVILPIDFGGGADAAATNLATRAQAHDWLARGGALGVFPGGTVSTAARPFGEPADPSWRPFTARLIARSGATVVPVHFEGQNSRLFQLASHLHPNLRLGLLLREFRRRTDRPVEVSIGAPIPPDVLRPMAGDAVSMMDFLRKATYDLGQRPGGAPGPGHDFEAAAKARGGRHGGGDLRQRAGRSDRP